MISHFFDKHARALDCVRNIELALTAACIISFLRHLVFFGLSYAIFLVFLFVFRLSEQLRCNVLSAL